jgi:hypothetical protein
MEKANSRMQYRKVLYVGQGRIVDVGLLREFQRVTHDLSNQPKDLDSLIRKCTAKSAEYRK